MANKYHINPATGNPGLCTAESDACPFSSDDEHYTSKEAAREAFENLNNVFKKPWRPSETKFDLDEVFIRAQALSRNGFYSVADDDVPIGGVILRVHHESNDVRPALKAEDGKYYAIVRSKSGTKSTLYPIPLKGDEIERAGSSGYYFSTPSDLMRKRLSGSDMSKNFLAHSIARELHRSWQERSPLTNSGGPRQSVFTTSKDGEKVDLANTSYDDLPEDLREENYESAKSVIDAISRSKDYGGSEDLFVPAAIHKSWMERNSDDDRNELKVSYRDLNDTEKAKDLNLLKKALFILNRSV